MAVSEKTFAQKMVENIQALLAGRALPNQDIESSNLNGQEITRTRRTDLLEELKFWELRVKNEQLAAGTNPVAGRAQIIIR
jgi:hypothetical protein